MEAPTLSANWKKLQQSFGQKQSKQTLKPGHNFSKRKRNLSDKDLSMQVPNSKRLRTDDLANVTGAETLDPSRAGKYIAIDCEMVGTYDVTALAVPAHNAKPGKPPEYSIVARVSLVDYNNAAIYDAYVLPPSGVSVSDYRTRWSGIHPQDLKPENPETNPKSFVTVQKEVNEILKDRILIGHAIQNDLQVMGLSHPRRDIRDTSRHNKYRHMFSTPGRNGKPGKAVRPGLKRLAEEVLGMNIQSLEGHSSLEDARATMMLFKHDKDAFEEENAKTFGRPRKGEPKRSVSKFANDKLVMNGNGTLGRRPALVDGATVDEDVNDEDSDEEGVEDLEEPSPGNANGVNDTSAAPRKKKKKKKKGKHGVGRRGK